MLNISGIIGKFIKNSSQREIDKLKSIVKKINSWESKIKDLPNESFPAKTAEFKSKVQKGSKLEDLMPEAFAYVREASKRTLSERHFDVQLMGGIILHQGKIIEMKTGEGKTLVATLPVYLNSLIGKGVHVVTVNDFLGTRDSEWMGKIYKFLGLSVGCITNEMSDHDRKKNYSCDVTYGTNNEFGFDYLRDNMKYNVEEMVQRDHFFCIVDEVDSILIDEARTPLIISGPAVGDADKYRKAMGVARKLKAEKHCELKEKEKQAILTEEGILEAQRLLGIEDFYTGAANMEWPHALEQCLRALHLFKGDVDYVVKDGQIIIVDEFTGRLMEGRRWSESELANAMETLGEPPEALLEAMKHALLAGGKRLRPSLVRLFCLAAGGEESAARAPAVAIEMIHTYSLIHDDLPCMDDDDLRRGLPTCHIKFDEATAILAGDALLTKAFEVLAAPDTHADPQVRADLVLALARAAGDAGMVGGQMLDLVAEGMELDVPEITRLQRMKTGELIVISCEAGAILGKASADERHNLQHYAYDIGLAFQIADDLLDVEGKEEQVGKKTGKDAEAGKATFVSFLGVERAREQATMLSEQAIEHLDVFGDKAEPLRNLAHFIVNRSS